MSFRFLAAIWPQGIQTDWEFSGTRGGRLGKAIKPQCLVCVALIQRDFCNTGEEKHMVCPTDCLIEYFCSYVPINRDNPFITLRVTMLRDQ